MENGVRFGLFFYEAERFAGRYDDQFDVTALGFALHFLHHGQLTVRSCADHEKLALPGDLFFDGQGRVSELVAESLGRCFLSFADFSAVDYDVVHVGAVVDLEGAEGEFAEVHGASCAAEFRHSSGR